MDTDIDWKTAVGFSRQGVAMPGYVPAIIGGLILTTTLLCPIFLGITIPMLYCVYREMFWQSGISEPRLVKKPFAVMGKPV